MTNEFDQTMEVRDIINHVASNHHNGYSCNQKRRKAQLIYVSLFNQKKIREKNSMTEYILFRSVL